MSSTRVAIAPTRSRSESAVCSSALHCLHRLPPPKDTVSSRLFEGQGVFELILFATRNACGATLTASNEQQIFDLRPLLYILVISTLFSQLNLIVAAEESACLRIGSVRRRRMQRGPHSASECHDPCMFSYSLSSETSSPMRRLRSAAKMSACA